MTEQLIELEITGLSSLGEGIGRYGGLAVFVAGSLPGERVQARLTQRRKNYARAGLSKLVLPAKERVTAPCPHYDVCGGCAIMHLAYEAQLRWKKAWLADALQRIGGLAPQINPTIGVKQPLGYRNRIQLHGSWQEGRLKLGFYSHGQHELTEVASCLIMRPLLARLTQLFNEVAPLQDQRMAGLRHLVMRCDSRGEQALLTLVGLPGLQELCRLAEQLMERETHLVSVWANQGRELNGIYGDSWRKLAGRPKLPDCIGKQRLQISPGAFTQVNAVQAELLYELVAHYADLSGAETVLDAYCGVGVIALCLAKKARQVIGVEEYAPAVEDAKQNMALNGVANCHFITGRVEDALALLKAKRQLIQVAVVDPPRAGCAAAALKALAELKPQRIIYVSCNPATLARDARQLCATGYALTKAQPLDMFPHTGHVEAIVLLERIFNS